MSEELLQTIPQQIGKYTYIRLGATTLAQLRANGIIPKKDYDKLSTKKPDGLVLHHNKVKAVVEYKLPKQLDTSTKIQKAIAQELEVAKTLCKILIVTDGSKSIWINALNGERILSQDGKEIVTVFHPSAIKHVATIESLVNDIDESISAKNSTVKGSKLIDPSPLAARLWQTIWVATGKSPVKCLYNVVELFIFKFLSDLNVLDSDINFAHIYSKSLANAEAALEFYAKNTRFQIQKLFPPGADGTTIINGTIFVTETGEANLTQSILFKRSLAHLQEYSEEFGSLTKIDKQFKTKLYESFLQQEVEALGQYFTPRRVIQSVIRMAGADLPTFQFQGKRICDPFCGVGGFPLELLNMNEAMAASYTPGLDCKISVPFVLHGFDKGFERDDERTIILAKANMLIYLAEKLFKHPQCSRGFAKEFNTTFRLFKDNLGTFGHILKSAEERYDLIFSNPPYVTSGSSIIKEELKSNPHTASEYPVNALGLEGISTEWIVKSLRPGGRAFIIIPDGILSRVGGRKLREHILQECILDAVISLPVRTFFANAEHTYVLAITKKQTVSDEQSDPVFTYVASNIGERLTSVKREEIDSDDLPEMELLFRLFSSSKSQSKVLLEKQSLRCKIQPISAFSQGPHWVIDRWWSKAERIAAGIIDAVEDVTAVEIATSLKELREEFDGFSGMVAEAAQPFASEKTVSLGETNLFSLSIGKRYLRKDVSKTALSDRQVPVYSANVDTPFGFTRISNLNSFTQASILWGIDGNFEFSLIVPEIVFGHTDHCGRLQVLDKKILPEFVLAALHVRRMVESFDRSFRASLTNMARFRISIPVDEAGEFDLEAQALAAERFKMLEEKRDLVLSHKQKADRLFSVFLSKGF